MSKTLGVMLAVMVTALGAKYDKSEVASVRQGAVFNCPSGIGLCKWTRKGWQKFWVPADGIPIVDFRDTSSGRIVIYEAGHLGSGALRILDKDGRTLLVRLLDGRHDLGDLVGESAIGSLLVCSDASCDLWLPEASDDQPLRLPSGCLAPRFFREGRAACRENETSIIVKSSDGGFQRVQAPIANLFDFFALNNGGAFLLRDLNAVYSWQPGHPPEKLSNTGVQWAGDSHNKVYFSECTSGPDFWRLHDCALYGITSNLKERLIWESGPIAVSRVAIEGNDLLVDARGNGKRQLLRLKEVDGGWKPEVLWSGQTEPTS